MPTMRLQKFLSAAGICSRRKGERYIQAGRITVNGHPVDQLGTKVDPDTDRVAFDGAPVTLSATHLYIALHKPLGYVSSCRQAGEKLVTDLVDLPDRLFPVGRLDKDSTGLILLTNDGRIHHRLSHPGTVQGDNLGTDFPNHAPDLAIASFLEDDFKPFRPQPFDFSRSSAAAIQYNPPAQLGQGAA